ncbi:hypothetical protein CCP3SC15_1740002 [Gammaproteobacteria bacterium]
MVNRAGKLDFEAINQAARGCLPGLLDRWLPNGKLTGKREYQALNPNRTDKKYLLKAAAKKANVSLDTLTEGNGNRGGQPSNDNLVYKKGELVACLANIHDLLEGSKDWRGVIVFDEFSQCTMKVKPPPYLGGAVGEWDGVDDSKTAMWLSREHGLVVSSAQVAEAIEVLARVRTIHPVREWLQSLKWDGVGRTASWLTEYLGVPSSEYSKRVARWFLLGMVARVMNPGVKFDYCIVLEGKQGKGKSKVFRILGGEWFGDTDLDLGNKDSMSALRGKWLYEFAELGSVTRAEASRQKSFLSRQVDEFRPVYGRREIKLYRQVVFGGTTNEWEWNKDPTGGRRFWPIECKDKIDLEGLAGVKDQLFAESFVRHQRGERFWPTPEEQELYFDIEQLKREQPDGLIDALHDWVYTRAVEFSIADAICSGLNLDVSKLTRDLQTRVGIVLRKLGCEKFEKRNGTIRFWYKPPVRKTAKSMSGPASMPSGVQDDIPW